MPKILDIELVLRQNYVDSDVTQSIIRYVSAHGFDAQNVNELLLELGYDEIFKDSDEIEYPKNYGGTTRLKTLCNTLVAH